LALVLNGSDGTFSSPINFISKIVSVKVSNLNIVSCLGDDTSVESLEFGTSEISKVVKAKDDIGLFSIELEDLKIVFSEGSESELFFTDGGVNLVMSELPLVKEILKKVLFKAMGGGESGDEDKGKYEDRFHA